MDSLIKDLLTFGSVFLMGLGLNLTPCVYPMLSVTISLFKPAPGEKPHKPFLKALCYVLGVATMYTALGVSAAMTGNLFGSLLQSRWVLLGIAGLFFALSLSLFGVYVFRLPAGLLQKIGSRKGSGLVGIYLSGILVGIFAAPCMGPTILALMTLIGTRGDPVYAFKIFFVMSLGLGLPYLIFGTFSGLLQKLPKSGGWLIWIERLFGVILLGFAFFYLTLAMNPSALYRWMPIFFLMAGIYLGWLNSSSEYTPAFNGFRRTFGAMVIAVGVFGPLFIPKEGVRWEIYSPPKLEQAAQLKKPVILDFYADWCIPCREVETFTYTDPRVIQAVENFVRLKVDLTSGENPLFQELSERLEVMGVPTILFLDSTGKEIPETRVTGFVSAEEFLKIIQTVQPEEKR